MKTTILAALLLSASALAFAQNNWEYQQQEQQRQWQQQQEQQRQWQQQQEQQRQWQQQQEQQRQQQQQQLRHGAGGCTPNFSTGGCL